MNHWAARRPLSVWIGLGITLVIWAGALWATWQLSTQLTGPPRMWPLTPSVFGVFLIAILGLILGGVLAYRTISALSLNYRIDRNAVTVRWLGNQAVIPMDRIQAVEIGLRAGARLPWFGTRVFGYKRGVGRVDSGEAVHLFATGSLHDAVTLVLPQSTYVITPVQRDAFVQEIEDRRGLGVVQSQSESVIRTTRVSYPFWTDRLVRMCFMIGFLLNLGLWGLISIRYTELAEFIYLRFDVTGAPIDLFPREQLLALPLIGLLTWLVNIGIGLVIYRMSRIGTLLLLIGASIIQVLLAVAIGNIVLVG